MSRHSFQATAEGAVGVGSGAVLGCVLLTNLSTCHLILKLTIALLCNYQPVNRLANAVKSQRAPKLNDTRKTICQTFLFSWALVTRRWAEHGNNLIEGLTA